MTIRNKIAKIGRGSRGDTDTNEESHILDEITQILSGKDIIIARDLETIAESIKQDFYTFRDNEEERRGIHLHPDYPNYKEIISTMKQDYGKVTVYNLILRQSGYFDASGNFHRW